MNESGHQNAPYLNDDAPVTEEEVETGKLIFLFSVVMLGLVIVGIITGLIERATVQP